MIDLTRLNGHRMVVNCDLIKFAEPAPDTTITLVTGEKLHRARILRRAHPAHPSLSCDGPSPGVARSRSPL